ncbi:MarR family winged helix-turn-helix transcriptional regulator [Novispirillum itersonii]|uniref:MarR family winged helix-turn-helix transcriptional regulator n=1 Tax=Novispirillum itersonii TaxID=189 RepID=UPI000377DCB1|nr:MarR family transcriptional regulator [Novispirillum itersonii]
MKSPEAVLSQPAGCPSDDDFLRLDQQVCFPLYAASNALTRAYRPVLAPLDLTYPQYLVMLVLWERDGLSVGDLGQRLRLDSGTLTPLLKRMEAAGLLSRQRASDDERRVEIHLTEAGRTLRQAATAVPPQMLCAMGLSIDELKSLKAGLESLLDRLDAG